MLVGIGDILRDVYSKVLREYEIETTARKYKVGEDFNNYSALKVPRCIFHSQPH